jgi:hypothetical protein
VKSEGSGGRVRLTAALALALWLAAPPAAVGQASAAKPALEWFAPPLLPPGALIAVVSGDPTAPGWLAWETGSTRS